MSVSYDSRPVAPAPPAADIAWPDPEPSALSHIRRPLKRLMLEVVDRGWFGLTPLRTHIVMAGFPRSGTTLLQAIITACVADIKAFSGELRGLPAARWMLRNQPLLLTKRPDDLYCLDELREFYRQRPARVRFVVLARDPRAVLTSRHYTNKDQYYVSVRRWRALFGHWEYANHFEDVISVRFEDMVAHIDDLQERLTAAIGWQVLHPFRDFHKVVPQGFDTRPMQGLRPLDPSRIEPWRQDAHRDRIRELIKGELPELPERLIEMGYEQDDAWVSDYV